jgi:RNA polymerase primary sigma factor
LRLVVKIARDYEHFGLPLLDLINEGNIGLMKAAERFDPAKGAKFSTYSSWWIKQGIKRALANQSKTIRIPVHLVDKISHMRKLSLRMREQLGREPNNEELAAEMGISVKRVAMMRRAALRPTSLDAPVVDDENRELAETVADENAVDAFDELNRKSREDQIHRFLDHLDERELEILNRRFGLDGRQAQTLEDIGEFFGVTRERIRQIQNHALNKLRQLMEREDSVQFSC